MDSCACNEFLHTNYNTRICNNCGRETQHGPTPEHDYTFKSLPIPYSRVCRFVELVTKLLGVGHGPRQTDPVWRVLEGEAPYCTTHQILLQLKRAKIVNKHYNSLHLFSKVFLSNYKPPDISPRDMKALRITMKSWFEQVLYLWNKSAIEGFFSYNWLIEQFLLCLKINCLFPYLKKLQCPIRRQKYADRWKIISNNILPLASAG